MTKRYVIEGEWTGYRPSQQRVVHRAVTTRPQRYEKLHTIAYTDGTQLRVSLRPCRPRERVEECRSYTRLIELAAATGEGYVSVRDLPD